MSAPAAIQGSYADLKFIKGRKVAQVVVEIPIEASDAFLKAFGAPNPAAEVPVALARLMAGEPEAAERPRRRMHDLPRAQQAGIMASDPVFQAFAKEMLKAFAKSEQGAAEAIRQWCGVTSRSQIEQSASASDAFDRLCDRYAAWKAAA